MSTKIHSVDHFLHLSQKDSFPTNLELSLWGTFVSPAQIKSIAATLIAGKCRRGLKLHFRENGLKTGFGQPFAEALKSGNCPKNFTIGIHNFIDENTEVIALATALESGNCPEGLTFDLSSNNLGPKTAEAFACALKSGKCPKGLRIDLYRNRLRAGGARALADALISGRCPEGLTMNLADNHLDDSDLIAIANALESGNCPNGLSIKLGNNNFGEAGIQALAKALQSGKCPENLSINLAYTHLMSFAGVPLIADALKSGNCPIGLSLDLEGSLQNIEQDPVVIFDALESGRCPKALSLHFGRTFQYMGLSEGLAQALESGKCPEGLTITADGLDEDDIIERYKVGLTTALQSGFAPHRLQLQITPEISLQAQRHNQALAGSALGFFTLLCTMNRMNIKMPKDVRGLIARQVIAWDWAPGATGTQAIRNFGRTFFTTPKPRPALSAPVISQPDPALIELQKSILQKLNRYQKLRLIVHKERVQTLIQAVKDATETKEISSLLSGEIKRFDQDKRTPGQRFTTLDSGMRNRIKLPWGYFGALNAALALVKASQVPSVAHRQNIPLRG